MCWHARPSCKRYPQFCGDLRAALQLYGFTRAFAFESGGKNDPPRVRGSKNHSFSASNAPGARQRHESDVPIALDRKSDQHCHSIEHQTLNPNARYSFLTPDSDEV
jgi:hypothetical protein